MKRIFNLMKARAEEKSENWYLYTYLDVFKRVKKFTCHHSKSKTSFHQESHPYPFIPSKPLIYIYINISIHYIKQETSILHAKSWVASGHGQSFQAIVFRKTSPNPLGCPHPSVVLHQGFLICLTASGHRFSEAKFHQTRVETSLGGSHPVSTPWEPTQDTLLTKKVGTWTAAFPEFSLKIFLSITRKNSQPLEDWRNWRASFWS